MQTVENIYHYWLEYNIYQNHSENIFDKHNMFRPYQVIIRCGNIWTLKFLQLICHWLITKSVNNVKISTTIKTWQVVNSTCALIYNMMNLLLSVQKIVAFKI
jgi:hypothetical protein